MEERQAKHLFSALGKTWKLKQVSLLHDKGSCFVYFSPPKWLQMHYVVVIPTLLVVNVSWMKTVEKIAGYMRGSLVQGGCHWANTATVNKVIAV